MDVPPSTNPAQILGIAVTVTTTSSGQKTTAVQAFMNAVESKKAEQAAAQNSGNGNGGGWSGDASDNCGKSSGSDPDPPGSDRGDGAICFHPDSLVRLGDGSLARVGSLTLDSVLASSSKPAPVIALYRDRRPKKWVSINGEPAFVTASHPVSTGRGFVPAGKLVSGDTLVMEDGGSLEVETVSVSTVAQVNVNIETESHCPYYVNGVLFGSYSGHPPR